MAIPESSFDTSRATQDYLLAAWSYVSNTLYLINGDPRPALPKHAGVYSPRSQHARAAAMAQHPVPGGAGHIRGGAVPLHPGGGTSDAAATPLAAGSWRAVMIHVHKEEEGSVTIPAMF